MTPSRDPDMPASEFLSSRSFHYDADYGNADAVIPNTLQDGVFRVHFQVWGWYVTHHVRAMWGPAHEGRNLVARAGLTG